MAGQLVTFAEAVKKGEANPAAGAHFIGIMGDGSATFLKGLNDRLIKLGPDYVAVVVGSAGYSRGEDKFMGPPAWKKTPAASKGGLVAGVLRDGDWNIALKWLGDNRIANNPDETTWDPDALNWVNATDYIEAAQKYVSGFCTELKNTKTGQKEKHCVDGVVTWTPGDVTVAEAKGGLVSIVSTKEYRSQMPHVIIGNKKWMAANRKLVTGMLAAIFEGGDLVKGSDAALMEAATVSAQAYNEKDAAYWAKYFKVQTQNDKQGLAVELGGSAVNNLADNMQLFGLSPGSANLFATTYTVFGELAKSQYPNIVSSIYPADKVTDSSYVAELGKAGGAASKPDLAVFAKTDQLKQVVSRKAWQIQFASGSAKFTPETAHELEQLFRDLVVAGGTLVEIHGHTDNKGTADQNQKLSEERAFAVKKWLEKESPTNFPDGRVRIFAHGMAEPVALNTTEEGRAANRRVEIVMGTSN
jgi:outer membrane protein OmpA-like peptidoglycan-associated protein